MLYLSFVITCVGVLCCCVFCFFFFKQKTAYEMRISDWSSDVCSSDLFTSRIEWTGNRGEGTRSYRGYDRSWSVTTPGQPVIHCSNDPRLGGDPGLPNPEDMLLSALAACHMLWYLHLASAAGIVVQS